MFKTLFFWSDSNGNEIGLHQLKTINSAKFSLFKRIEISEKQDIPISITVRDLVTYAEIYFDDHLIGSTRTNSNYGDFFKIIRLPDSLLHIGTHHLELKVFNQTGMSSREYGPRIFIGDYITIEKYYDLRDNQRLMVSGMHLMALILVLLLYFAAGEKLYLYYSFFLFGFAAEMILTSQVILFNFDNSVNYLFNIVYGFLAILRAASLPIFFLIYYAFKQRNNWILFFFLMSIFVYFLDSTTVFQISIVASLLILAVALYQRKKNASIAFISTSILLLPMVTNHIYQWFIFLQFLSSTLFLITDRIRLTNKLAEDQKEKIATFELEKVKKHIQPHYILNTLSSLISWVSKDPNQAINFVQLLASEFRAMNQITPNKLIPIKTELELCDTQLKLMAYRKNAIYSITSNNLQTDMTLPPLIFHTIIENGLTHSFKSNENGQFYIEYDQNEMDHIWTISHYGSLIDLNKTVSEGYGMHYIRTSLAAIFGINWTLNYGATANKWSVSIHINKAAYALTNR